MKNPTHSAQNKHLDSLAAAAKRYVLNEMLDMADAVAEEINSLPDATTSARGFMSATDKNKLDGINLNDAEFIEGTQTAATGSWTGVTKDSALYKGKFIIYKLPYAGSGNATLNLTLSTGSKTGAKNVYRYGTTRLSTQYGANYYVPLIYNGTYWFALADYDVNYYDRIRVANPVAVADGAVKAVTFVGSTDGTNYKQLSSGATFNINYPVFYNSSAVADAANMSTGLYFAIGAINLQTLVDNTSRTFTAQVPLYLKGTLSGDTFTVHSDIITTTVPTTADGFIYLCVGRTYSTYQAYIVLFQNRFFAYLNGAFREFNPFALKALQDSLGQQIDSTYIKNISASNGVLTLTKGDNSSSNVTVASSDIVLSTVPSTVDGGLWFELVDNSPVIKLYYDGSDFIFNPAPTVLLDPELTVTPSTITVCGNDAYATISYLGNGEITVSSNACTGDNATYNPTTRVLTEPYNNVESWRDDAISLVSITLGAAGAYDSATAVFTVWHEPE